MLVVESGTEMQTWARGSGAFINFYLVRISLDNVRHGVSVHGIFLGDRGVV